MPKSEESGGKQETAEDTRKKIHEIGGQTKDMLHELSGKMSQLSDKINAIPIEDNPVVQKVQRLAEQVNKRIGGETEALDADDQQRLQQQQLDVNRTSDTDPLEETRRWSAAKRE